MRYCLRTTAIVLLVAAIILLAACGSHSQQQPANPLLSISITGLSSTAMLRGSTAQLSASGTYGNGNTFPLVTAAWSSSDPSVATVSSNGLVTAVGSGTTRITASMSGVQARGSVSVQGLANGAIGPNGATITVDVPGDPANGTTIVAAPNSTAGGVTVHLALDDRDALPGAVGEGVVQASKVYVLSKDIGYNFAKPLAITIPVDHVSLTGNEFPVVFSWSTTDNRYRASPLTNIDRTNDTVTFKADHTGLFVALAVPTLATTVATLNLDTNFRPSADGFFHPNTGSYDTAGGACMGMTAFTEWYFGSKKQSGGDPGLATKYLEGDVTQWQDDVTAAELIDRTFEATKNIWGLYSNAATSDESLTPAENALAAWIALVVSNEPQTMLMRFANGQAHAVSVYNWDHQAGTFGVYDSNFPMDDTVKLSYDPTNGFANYTKAGAYSPIQSFTFLPMGLALDGAEFDALYQGAEAAFAANAFDQIAIAAPTPDQQGHYVVPDSQALTVSGTVSGAGAVRSTSIVYSWNGTRLGVAPITNGTFSFTIAADKVTGYANGLTLVSTSDANDVWLINGRSEITTKIQGAAFITNPSFEAGDFSGWTVETHLDFDPGTPIPTLSAVMDNTVQPFDEMDPTLPTTYTGRYAARVNDSTPNNHVSSITQNVTVPSSGASEIRFHWAAMLQDSGHLPPDRPYVDIKVHDDTANADVYYQHFFANDPSYTGWTAVNGWQEIGWQTVVVSMAGAAGHQVTITVTAADCTGGGHGGYAYFDSDDQ
jgi:hypothetical protein